MIILKKDTELVTKIVRCSEGITKVKFTSYHHRHHHQILYIRELNHISQTYSTGSFAMH